ncbi:hypothetical protein [Halorussus lipolyticus]|uniref:hypothetical protein n=1 Tax=Halorussus lipolyticus TaxID=3034024 RepID=UPI0023E8B26F|nr:hypothetical protein [Halorussus sp. DT80]
MDSSLDWVAVALGVLLAGIHVYLGVTTDQSPFVVVGAGFLLGVVFFLTRYWRPVLYLLGVIYALVLGFIWLLNGMEYRTIGLVTGAISVAFLVLISYLFAREGGLV